MLTKQEMLLGKRTRVESSRVREPRRTTLLCVCVGGGADVAGRGTPSRAKLGFGLTHGNELSEETHVLTKQEILLGKCAWVESSRVREPRRTVLPHGLQSRVLW